MRLDKRYQLMNLPEVEEGLELENITKNNLSQKSIEMNDGSSIYKFLWDYIIYKSDLTDTDLKLLEDVCIKYSAYHIVLFQLIISTCDSAFKRGYMNSGLRNDYDFKFSTSKQKAPEHERNYVQSPQDEIPCCLANGSFVMTARSVNEIGIEELEAMLVDAEESSPMKDPYRRIRKEEYEQYLVDRCGLLRNPFLYSSFYKALESDNINDITGRVIRAACLFSASKGFEHSLGMLIEPEQAMPCRITDGEFVFPPVATKQIGAKNLNKLMHEANNRARAKEKARANA